ncbi:uncharacterized protein [Montipora capricornis]
MCQEYHCECCSDELPEDSCECIDCSHGEEDTSISKWSPCADQGFCDCENDFCDAYTPLISSSHASFMQPSKKELEDSCRNPPCEIKCCSEGKESKTDNKSPSNDAEDCFRDPPCQVKCCSGDKDTDTANISRSNEEAKDCFRDPPCQVECCSGDKDTDTANISLSNEEVKDCFRDPPCQVKCCSGDKDTDTANISRSNEEAKDCFRDPPCQVECCSGDKDTDTANISLSNEEVKDCFRDPPCQVKCCSGDKDTDTANISLSNEEAKDCFRDPPCQVKCCSGDKDTDTANISRSNEEAKDCFRDPPCQVKCCSGDKDTDTANISLSNEEAKDCFRDPPCQVKCCSGDKDTDTANISLSNEEAKDCFRDPPCQVKCCSGDKDNDTANISLSNEEAKDCFRDPPCQVKCCSGDKENDTANISRSNEEAKDCFRDPPCQVKCCSGDEGTDTANTSRSNEEANIGGCFRNQPYEVKCCSGGKDSKDATVSPKQPRDGTKSDSSAGDSFPLRDCCSRNKASKSQSPLDCSCEKEKPRMHNYSDSDVSRPCCVDASSMYSFSEATNSCQSSCCQGKPHNVTYQSLDLDSKLTCCGSEACLNSTDKSRILLAPVTHTSTDGKYQESKARNGHSFELQNRRVTFTCPCTEDECCEKDTCNCDSTACYSGDDDCCQKKLQVELRSKSVSRISMTDCSGFYPDLPTPPGSPLVIISDSSGKKSKVHMLTTKLRVQNLCCPMEGKLVQESLEPLEGVTSIAVNVIGRVAYVRHDPEVTSASELVTTLNRVHLGASIMETGSPQSEGKNDTLPRSLQSCFVYLLIQTFLLLTAVVAFFVGLSWYKWVAITEIVFGICPVLKKAFVSFKTLSVDINILILIAVAGTLAINEWVEGAAVVYVFSLAEALQEFCMHKVQRTISGLMLKAPQVAILASTGECVPVEEVTIGTVIAIRPGELIPLDGIVVTGRASVDESSVSGESVPVEKTTGSKAYSGTVNQNGYLEVETTSDSSSSTVTKVAQLVQEAQTGSASMELAINRFAKYYTPAVVIAAVLVVAVPAILGAAGVGTYASEVKEWGRRALVLLVIACPCALVMSTPIAMVCGITAAAQKGSLIKGGAYLETLARLEVLAFDKTGTLTEGKFQVVGVECASGVHERSALRLAAALESKSSHPLAAAIVNEFAGCVAEMVASQNSSLPEVSRFELHEGQGISGVVDGHLVQIGNFEFLQLILGSSLTGYMEDKYITWSNESKTVIFVSVDNTLAMMIALADTIRPDSMVALNRLRKLRVQSAMITGDNARTALAVKTKLGLDECVAEMKPENKLSWITDRQTGNTEADDGIIDDDQPNGCCLPIWFSRRPYESVKSRVSKKSIVGMVGDGVNDGPALAAANVGIAMGAGGTALAVEAADVALMSNNLSKIPELVELGRLCRLIVAQNIAFSVILKLAIVIATLAGKTYLWMAVMADVLGLLFVILNGLRPLRWKISDRGSFKSSRMEISFAENARQVSIRESRV